MASELRLLRLPAVLSRVGVKRSTLYRWISDRRFPPPLRIGENTSAWVESEVDQWIALRIAARDSKEAA